MRIQHIQRIPPYVTVYIYRKYSYIEIDFIGYEHLNTSELRRGIWDLFEHEVVSVSELWRKVMNLEIKPKKRYTRVLHYIEEFKRGVRDDIPHILGFGNTHLCFGLGRETLIFLPAEKHLIEKFIHKVKKLVGSFY